MALEEINLVLQEMHSTQHEWRTSPVSQRELCLNRMAELLLDTKEVSARLITEEMGKPLAQALAEVEKCARLCSYYAKEGKAFLQAEMVQTDYVKSYRSFHPLGIILGIMPWNFPFWQVFRFATPNIMAGNAALLKHAPNSTGAGLRIEQLFLEAGFPKNLFRTIVTDVEDVASVIKHPLVTGISLTGSNRAGKSVASTAGQVLKKVVLELGGNDPYVILEDADLKNAAQQCVLSRLNNAGQVCIAAKRLIVVTPVKEQFEALILDNIKAYVMGDPLSANTTLGPMARKDLRDTLQDQVSRLKQQGARCLVGGEIPDRKGYYYPVTVFTDVKEDTLAFEEEIFGPVICIVPARDEAHALELANATDYGLAAVVFTSDTKRGERIAENSLHAGTCAVNTQVKTDPRLPFGGIKQSGFGRELSIEGMREFMNVKTIIVD